MKRDAIRTVLFLLFLTALPAISYAAPELRTALVIGNSAYSSGPLKNPVNDATDMAAALQKAGFTVTLKTNSKLREMEEAIESFGSSLKRGGVGLFYFAGHGVQVNGVNYLLPVGAKINKESDVKYEAVDANKILDEMGSANNGLNIVLLDACRDNPFAKSFRSASRGLAIVSSELVNENETPPATIYCSADSLLGDAGLLIQTTAGRAAGCGIFPLNRFGCIS